MIGVTGIARSNMDILAGIGQISRARERSSGKAVFSAPPLSAIAHGEVMAHGAIPQRPIAQYTKYPPKPNRT